MSWVSQSFNIVFELKVSFVFILFKPKFKFNSIDVNFYFGFWIKKKFFIIWYQFKKKNFSLFDINSKKKICLSNILLNIQNFF
jgi:hypothetical protein